MTEEEWLACADPTPMLEFLRGKASARKLRLCAVAFSRNVFHLIAEMNRNEIDAAITVAEQFAEGTGTEVELLYIYDGQIPWNDEYVAAIEACNPDAGSGGSQLCASNNRNSSKRLGKASP